MRRRRVACLRPLLDTVPPDVRERDVKDHRTRVADRRSVRTRTALRDALLSLLAEQGWDAIGVQDICERADVARSTFYLHYTGKDELLQGGLNDLQAHLQAAAFTGQPPPDVQAWLGFRFSLGLIEHAYENRVAFRSLIGRRSGFAVQQRFSEMVLRLVDFECPATQGELPRIAVVRQLAAVLTELMAWSVEQCTPMPAQRLAAEFDRVAVVMLGRR